MNLETHRITTPEYGRDLWLLPAPQKEGVRRLGIFLDAELYLKHVDAVATVTRLMNAGAIPPMTCVLVSHVDSVARHADYTCNGGYTRFIAEDVVSWAQARDPLISRTGHLICGLSLSALAAAFAALKHPEIFPAALCQSGSFWWWKDHPIELPAATRAKFWLSVGDRETAAGLTHAPSGMFQGISQVEGVELAVNRLRNLGATVKHSVHPGTHSAEPWKQELAPALTWLVGKQ